MALQFHPLPAELFPVNLQPFIARHNTELRELFGLEGVIRQPLSSRRSDSSIVRGGVVQVDVSRITPSIVQVISGQSTVVGTPALTLGTVNTIGSTTTAISINSAIALFGTGLPAALASSALAGTSAYAARADHVHLFPTSLQSAATASTLALTDDATNQKLTGNLGFLEINPSDGGYVLVTTNGTGSAAQMMQITPLPSASMDALKITISNPSGVQSSQTFRGFNFAAAMAFGMTACTMSAADIQFNLTPTAGSSGTNNLYQMRLTGGLINNANASFTDVVALDISGARRLVSGVTVTNPTATIRLECPTIGGTSQFGLYIRQRTAQVTAANRIGIRIDAQNSGTNRWSIKTSDRIENDTTDLHASASGKGLVVLASDDTTRWLRIRALYNGGAPSITIDDIGTTQPSP